MRQCRANTSLHRPAAALPAFAFTAFCSKRPPLRVQTSVFFMDQDKENTQPVAETNDVYSAKRTTKRLLFIEVIKSRQEYGLVKDMVARSTKHPISPPCTPDHKLKSKRMWEEQAFQWRTKLRLWSSLHEETRSASCRQDT